MILNEDLFEIDIPIVNPEPELTIDEIEQPTVATPEENGVATMLINSISDTWDKINEYNGIISTVSVTNVDNADEIISVVKDVVDTENENVGKLVSALKTISPNTENIEVGKEEAEMKLTESLDDDKIKLISDILGKNISSSEGNYIYDNWRAFYNDPELFKDTPIIDMVNTGLEEFNNSDIEKDSNTEIIDSNEEDDDMELEDQVVIDDDFINDSLSEDVQKPVNKTPYRLGTIRYDANEGRKKRIDLYKKLTNVDENVQLTEGALKKWAVDRVACFTNTTPERVKNELLGNKWSEFEED